MSNVNGCNGGVAAEELLDGVEIGGVATMLDASDESNMSLFI